MAPGRSTTSRGGWSEPPDSADGRLWGHTPTMSLGSRRPEERNGSRHRVEADLNAKDDDGICWSTLADARDPSRLRRVPCSSPATARGRRRARRRGRRGWRQPEDRLSMLLSTRQRSPLDGTDKEGSTRRSGSTATAKSPRRAPATGAAETLPGVCRRHCSVGRSHRCFRGWGRAG